LTSLSLSFSLSLFPLFFYLSFSFFISLSFADTSFTFGFSEVLVTSVVFALIQNRDRTKNKKEEKVWMLFHDFFSNGLTSVLCLSIIRRGFSKSKDLPYVEENLHWTYSLELNPKQMNTFNIFTLTGNVELIFGLTTLPSFVDLISKMSTYYSGQSFSMKFLRFNLLFIQQ